MKASQLKSGIIIKFENKYFKVLKSNHSHIGRGKANVELQLKNILTGQNLTRSFKSDEELEDIEIEKRQLEFAYRKGEQLFFFADANDEKKEKAENLFFGAKNNKSFLALILKNNLGNQALFLKKGIKVIGIFVPARHSPRGEGGGNQFLTVELPVKETYQVISAPPGIKGNTAQGGSKVVEIDSGAKVSVPLFIKEGDLIVVNTETGEYNSRTNF